jgi:uncharacterized membrane protein
MQTLFPGLHAMQNIHPLLVHFPIALWIAALLFELVSLLRSSEEWHRNAARLLYLGALFGLAAAATGWLAQRSVPPSGDAHDVMELHETLMLFALSAAGWLSLVAYLRPNLSGAQRKWFLAGLIVLVLLTVIGSDRGAELVYRYAISVRLPSTMK